MREELRKVEIDAVKRWFGRGLQVLEIGGGSGYQASIMASWGCKVVSIDIPDRTPPPKLYYHVLDYDGRNFPFPNASFDIVFSSNVLEHIQHLPPIFAEIRRVLKPGGLSVRLPNAIH